MNKLCHRVVFNVARGALMVVAECARSHTRATGVNVSSAAVILHLSLRMSLLGALFAHLPAQAQVIADPKAPATQRPTILQTGNGLKLINIQSPSKAGVSRNAYQQFDIDKRGAILNNAYQDVQTQIGGWVQGNPWLATGSARIILNEVNSSKASLLNGPLEVAGQKAQVVVANPAGISCDGCGFINADRTTLTTGRPLVSAGAYKGLSVQQGQIIINGVGYNASGSNYSEILARAVQINAGLWAQHLAITTGVNDTNAQQQNQALKAPAIPAPQFALDVSSLGGLYANSIFLIGTEAGVGVRNAGIINAQQGQLVLHQDGRLENTGRISSSGPMQLSTTEHARNAGQIYSPSSISMSSNKTWDNTGGLVRSTQDLSIKSAEFINAHSASPEQGLQANNLSLQTQRLDNDDGQILTKGRLDIGLKQDFTHQGLIQADGDVHLQTPAQITNQGKGRIFGKSIAIQAESVVNQAQNGQAPVIAAQQDLDIGAKQIINREHALLLSGGDMALGGSLDAQQRASGQAQLISNNSASIEALGHMRLSAQSIQNTDEHFSTQEVEIENKPHQEYQISGSPDKLPKEQISLFNDEVVHLKTPNGVSDNWTRYDFQRVIQETQVQTADPARISAGGQMQITAQELHNDKSQIVAGGTLSAIADQINNLDAKGQRITTDQGGATHFYRDHEKGRDSQGSSWAAYKPAAQIQTLSLAPASYQAGAGLSATPQSPLSNPKTNGSLAQPIDLSQPQGGLFQVNTGSGKKFFIETNPAFANHRQWLSSDYLLQSLALDSSTLQKRLGDGYYEQNLLRQQVLSATGQRYLQGFTSDEAQYIALMNAGVSVAQTMKLRPGISLNPEQVAALTTSMVWLVEQEVKLPDGHMQKAWVPQLYLASQASGTQPAPAANALLSAGQVQLTAQGTLFNSGSITGQKTLRMQAQDVVNAVGQMRAAQIDVQALQDISNSGGQIKAASLLNLGAGRDLLIASNTQASQSATGQRQNLSAQAQVTVQNPDGQLLMQAGRDVRLDAALLGHASATTTDNSSDTAAKGQVSIQAGRQLQLGTLTESQSNRLQWDEQNHRQDSQSQEVGTVIQSKGKLQLIAGQDLQAKAATINSQQGAVQLMAKRDLQLQSGQNTQALDESHQSTGTSSWLSSSTYTSQNALSQSQATGTLVTGKTVELQAGQNLHLSGSQVVSDSGTTLAAAKAVDIEGTAQAQSSRSFQGQTSSGLMRGSVLGFTLGSRQQSGDNHNQSQTMAGSTIGSIGGDVRVDAGERYTQSGSQVIAPQGDIAILAQDVHIKAAQNTSQQHTTQKSSQTGFSIALSNPVVDAVQTAQSVTQAMQTTSDGRMQALGAASVGLNAYNTRNNLTDKAGDFDASKATGINLNISLGKSSSQSQNIQNSSTATGSQLMAGGDVDIIAQRNVQIQGSQLTAGQDVHLQAGQNLILQSAQSTTSQKDNNSSLSGSVGVSVGTSAGASLTASLSKGQGHANGQDQTQVNTLISAGKTLELQSGQDTQISGAVVQAAQVRAQVGGNLLIESRQDTSTYKAKDQSLGVGVGIPIGPGPVSLSVQGHKTDIDSSYASVTQQSGIRAGDGGFQVQVAGNTELKGGVITSTQAALDQGHNQFQTGGQLQLSDIQNKATYQGQSAALSLSFSGEQKDGKGQTTPAQLGASAGIGHQQGSASSTSVAAISGVAGKKNARTGDQETGIKQIFEAEKVRNELLAQVTITKDFNRQATAAVNTFTDKKIKHLQQQIQSEPNPTLKAELQKDLDMWSRPAGYTAAMNIIVASLSAGNLGASSAVSKESLVWAADQMRQAMMADSQKFSGICDSQNRCLDNKSGQSSGVNGDAFKLGGNRVDLDVICGQHQERCQVKLDERKNVILDTRGNPILQLNEAGQVIFTAGSLDEFLTSNQEALKQRAPAGGWQGREGQLKAFGIGGDYPAHGLADKLVEAYAGTHDMMGSGMLYDELGNRERGRSEPVRKIQDITSGVLVLPATPFALATLLPPEIWHTILLGIKSSR